MTTAPTRTAARPWIAWRMLQLQGCEGSFNFPTIIAGNVTSPGGARRHAATGQRAEPHAHPHRAAFVQRQLTWVHGNHTYKAGAEVWFQAHITAPPTGVGLNFAASRVSTRRRSVTNLRGDRDSRIACRPGAYTRGLSLCQLPSGRRDIRHAVCARGCAHVQVAVGHVPAGFVEAHPQAYCRLRTALGLRHAGA